MNAVTAAYWLAVVGFAVGLGVVWRLYDSLEGSPHRSALAYLAVIPGAAGLAYAAMALGVGTLSTGASPLILPRYVDWLLTTPLLVGFVGYVAGASRRSIAGVMAADVAMIVIGSGAVLTDGVVRWVLFGVSSLCYIAILGYLYGVFPRTVPDKPAQVGLFNLLKNHIGLLWVAYPVVWFAGPKGVGYATAAGLSLTFAFLDVLAKVPYVYFFYARRDVFGEDTDTALSGADESGPAPADD